MDNECQEKRFNIHELKTPPARGQAAEYIREILGELIQMARDADLSPIMPHLLAMAKLEADKVVRRLSPRRRVPRQE
jgi:hypothetical protein